MVITNKNVDKDNINISINGSRLEIEKEIKYLGVVTDDNLRFDKNIDHICKKIGKKTSVLGRLRNELNNYQKLNVYRSIIEPHFTYCASILYLSNSTDTEIQNKCMRQILRTNRFTSTVDMLNTLNLLSINQMVIFRTLIFIFKIIRG